MMHGTPQAGARTAIWTWLLALAFCVAAAAQPFATVEDAQGAVLVRAAGQTLWVEAGTGHALQPGDAVRTGAESSASLSLPGGGTTQLLAMTRVALQSVTAPDGLQSVVVDVQQGRVMARMNFDKDPDHQFVLRANQAVMRGRSASIFVQAGDNSAGCFDVFRGAVTAASLGAPDDTVKIEASHRALVQDNSPFVDFFTVSDLPAESALGAHQCMAVPEEEKMPPAPGAITTQAGSGTAATTSATTAAVIASESTDTEIALVVTTSTRVVLASNEEQGGASAAASDGSAAGPAAGSSEGAAVAFVPEAAPSGSSAYPDDTNSLSPGGDEEEYVTVSVSSSSNVKFVSGTAAAKSTDSESAEAAQSGAESDDSSWAEEFDPNAACKLLPTISGVTANGKDANAGMTVTLEYTQCGDMEMTIEGTASSECGSIREVTVLVDDKKRVVEGKKNWKAVVVFEEEDYHAVSVQAEDVTDAKSLEFEFEIEQAKAVDAPTVAVETVAGQAVSAFGDALKLNYSNLVNNALEIRGGAESLQCQVVKVDVSVDGGGTWAAAEGNTNWSYAFAPRQGSNEIMVRAFDEDGNESEEMFSPVEIDYTPKSDEDLLKESFERIMQAYRDKNADGVLDEVADTFSSSHQSIADKSRMDISLNDKFLEQASVYVRYQVTSTIVSGESGRVMFNWDANAGTSGYAHSGVFVFTKADGEWKLMTVEDSATFLRHTSEAAYIVNLEASPNTIEADQQDSSDITAEVRDSAYNPVRDGTSVTLTATSGTISSALTSGGGRMSATYTAPASGTSATITAASGSATETVSITLTSDAPPPPPGN